MQIWLNYLDQILIYAAFALSLNLLLGYAGQVSVASAAFGAIGGYTMGYLVMTYGWSFVPTAIIGTLFAFLAGTLVSLPAQKLSGEYLILLTLAISSVILGVFTTFPQLGGTYGLISIPQPEFFGWTMRRPSDWVIPTLVLVAFTYAVCWRLGESAFGRVLKGIREDGEATQALGKNVFAYKVGVFGITAGLAGLAGAFYSGWLGLATPTVFGFAFALTLFAIVIFGGMANLTGSIVGAAAVTLLEPILRRTIHTDPAKASLYQLVIYGVGLVVLMMVRPQGVLPEGFSVWRRIRHGRAPRGRVEMDEMWEPHPRSASAPARSDRHRRRRTGSPGRTRRRVAERPGGAGGAWHHEELRRHRRRRGPRLRSPPGHDHCARRAERRRQDHGVQPTHRVHPARPRQCQAERQRARGALPRQGGAPRSRPLVPERASLQPHLVRPERDARGAEPAG